jgi:hypothetical protein
MIRPENHNHRCQANSWVESLDETRTEKAESMVGHNLLEAFLNSPNANSTTTTTRTRRTSGVLSPSIALLEMPATGADEIEPMYQSVRFHRWLNGRRDWHSHRY